MLLEPQDPRGSVAAAGGEGGSATATPAQQVTVFSANDAAAEFRAKVSSQMKQELAVASVSHSDGGTVIYIHICTAYLIWIDNRGFSEAKAQSSKLKSNLFFPSRISWWKKILVWSYRGDSRESFKTNLHGISTREFFSTTRCDWEKRNCF